MALVDEQAAFPLEETHKAQHAHLRRDFHQHVDVILAHPYTEVNGYLIPDLALPDDGLGDVHIGIWGQRRFDYLKQYKNVLFTHLLTGGKLHGHIHEIDIAASERKELIVKQMMEAQGVTEQMKAEDMMSSRGLASPSNAPPSSCRGRIVRL